jgi:hypothetical protein
MVDNLEGRGVQQYMYLVKFIFSKLYRRKLLLRFLNPSPPFCSFRVHTVTFPPTFQDFWDPFFCNKYKREEMKEFEKEVVIR